MEVQIVTELSNDITRNIDVVGSSGIVRLLRECDAQVFSGWEQWVGLNDSLFLENVEALSKSIFETLKGIPEESHKKVKVLMSGAGTSGRLSYFCARSLNAVAKDLKLDHRIVFDYLMAGNDIALMKSVEKAEDDVFAAMEDLKTKSTNASDADDIAHYVYIGITCGLSAPYVGGQLHWLLNLDKETEAKHKDSKWTLVLMGFNDPSVARKNPIENWNLTMFDVVSQLISKFGDGHHFALTPIVGPEPITGSSRMKSGTTTKILLEALFGSVFERAVNHRNNEAKNITSFAQLFLQYELTCRHTYFCERQLAAAIDFAGDSLRSGGNIYYLAEDPQSILGLIDASECPPTYGALFTDVRGFVIGGWNTMRNVEGDLSHIDSVYRISETDFQNDVVPKLTATDIIVVLHSEGQRKDRLIELLTFARKSNNDVRVVIADWRTSNAESIEPFLEAVGKENVRTITVTIPSFYLLFNSYTSLLELSTKWVLNAISTGAHVLKGKVFKNKMIDLCLSNNKLYYRGIALVASLMATTPDKATDCVLRAIHNVDEVPDLIRNYPISTHYKAAVKRAKVIPISVLLASGRVKTVKEAQETLAKEPILRNFMLQFVKL